MAVGDGGGGVDHEVDGLGGFWEGDDFAEAGCAGEEHDDAVEAEGDAAVGRGAVLEGVKEEAETGLGFFVGDAERLEDLLLNVLAVNTDGAGAELEAVHRDVVAVGADAGGVGEEVGHVSFVGRGEGMVGGHPLLERGVVLKHGKVSDPDGLEGLGCVDECVLGFVDGLRGLGVASGEGDDFVGDGEGAVFGCVLFGELDAEVAGGEVDVDLALGEAAGEFCVAGLDVMRGIAGDDDEEVGVGGAGEVADFVDCVRESSWRGA